MGLLSGLWQEMYRTGRPFELNPENWGLADWPLREVVILSGERQVMLPDALSTAGLR